MKKILFFIESLAGGGAEKVLTDIVSNLDSKKYDITVCTVTDEDVYQEQVETVCKYRSFLHKKNYRAGGLKKVIFWFGIKLIYMLPVAVVYKLFIKEKYDIEVAFVEGFATKLIASSRNPSSDKIAWVHTNMMNNPHADSLYKNIEEHKKAYNNYHHIVCVSHSVKDAFLDKFSITENLLVQYNPVDEEKIMEKGKELLEERVSNYPVLCTVGRLEEVKGYRRLLKISKQLIREGFLFELWIIGDGSQKDEFQEYVSENDLTKYIKLLGYQKNPYKYIYSSDAFICSSYEEGFSTAATESLILGKPIFTVECAGMRELFDNTKCGEIVENSDEALYQMLKRIVSKKNYIKAFQTNVLKRSCDFKLSERIHEIDNLLSM